MKKAISLLLALVLCLSLYACGSNTANTSGTEADIPVATAPIVETTVATPTETTPAETLPADTVVKMGDVVENDYIYLSFDTFGSDAKIRSGASGTPGAYYYESDNGDPFFYVYGTFKNLGGKPVDIRRVYGQFCFNGKYYYEGNFEGVVDDYGDFVYNVTPLSTVNYYMFAVVPQELVDSYTTCTVRFGFTEDFGYTVVDGASGLPKFEECDDVFLLEITR